MKHRFRLMIISALLLTATVLAGCGGGDAGGNGSTSTSAPAAVAPGITVAPLSGAPETVDVSSVSVGDFKLNITGSITAEVRGTGLAQVASASSPEKSITLLLYASGANDTPARGVTVVMPDSITPGTFAIQSYYGVFNTSGQVTGIGAVISEPGSGSDSADRAATLFDASGGELALASVDPMTGTLTLDAKSEDGGVTVQVEGVFNQVTVNKTP